MNVIYHHINGYIRVLIAACTIKACLRYVLVLHRNKDVQHSSSFKISHLWFLALFSVAQNGVVSANIGVRLHEPDSVVSQMTAQSTPQNTAESTVDIPPLEFVRSQETSYYLPQKNPIPVATFTQASAMIKGMDGFIVSDKAEHKIYLFNSDGKLLIEAGGHGAGVQSFHAPSDIASNNGLKIYVADKENGRIQILDHQLHYLSSLDITRANVDYAMGLDSFSATRSWKPEKICLLDSGHLQVWDAQAKGIHRFNSKGDYLGFSALSEAMGRINFMYCKADYIKLYSTQSQKIARMSINGLWLGSYDFTQDRAYESNIFLTTYAGRWDELEEKYGRWVHSTMEESQLWILFEQALFSLDVIQKQDNE